MYPIRRISRRARRAGASTLLASVAALGVLSSAVPSAAAQSSPNVTIADIVDPVTEGSVATFQVTVHGAHTQFTVDYKTVDGSGANGAIAGSDYTSTSSTLTIPADSKDTTVGVDVPTINDNVFEPDKKFHMNLSNSIYTIKRIQGDATIHSEDPLPVVTVRDAQVNEGDPPQLVKNTAMFEVLLSNPASEDVSVDYATVDKTNPDGSLADDGALGTPGLGLPGDYRSVSGTLTFPAGTNPTKYVIVTTKPDLINEGNEQFYVQLSNATNSRLAGNGRATGTIVDDDPEPHINIDASASVWEGEPSPAPQSQVGLNVTLTNPSKHDVSFSYETANGSALLNDYVASSGTVTIPAGSMSTGLLFDIKGDNRDEDNETFSVILSNPSNNAKLGNSTGIVTINDDD